MTNQTPPSCITAQRPRPGLPRRLALALVAFATLGLAGCTAPQQGWGGVTTTDADILYASPSGKVYKLDPTTRQGNAPGIVPAAGEWQFPPENDKRVGHFYAPPTVTQGAIFVASTPAGASEGKVFALNPENGQQLWEYPKKDNPQGRRLGILVASPAYGGGMVFVSDGVDTVYALDAATGEERWSFKARNKVWSSPAVQNGVVYFGSLDHSVYALDTATGNKVWEFQAGGAVPGSPLLTRDTLYIGAADKKLYALDPASGAKKWEFQARNWFWTQPLLHDGIIYANALDHRIYALNAATGEPVWPEPFQAPKLVMTPPVMAGDALVVAAEDGRVIAIDPKTGQQTGAVTVEPNAMLHGVPAALNGIAYVPGVDNHLFAIDAAGQRMLWTFKAS